MMENAEGALEGRLTEDCGRKESCDKPFEGSVEPGRIF